jgi:hypothetical protein
VLGAFGLHRGGALGVAVGAILILVPVGFALRGASTVLVADEGGVEVRNLTRNAKIPWRAIDHFEVGRYKLLGCVLLIRLGDGGRVPVFGVQGITGQPHRKTSVEARKIADELNSRLAQATGVVREAHAGRQYPSRNLDS